MDINELLSIITQLLWFLNTDLHYTRILCVQHYYNLSVSVFFTSLLMMLCIMQLVGAISSTKEVLGQLGVLRQELMAVARRGSVLYFIMHSLACLRPEYSFSTDEFLALFDEAIGGSAPPPDTTEVARRASREVLQHMPQYWGYLVQNCYSF